MEVESDLVLFCISVSSNLFHYKDDEQISTLADAKGDARYAPPLGPNSFHFLTVFGKNLIGWRTTIWGWCPI